MPAVNHQGKKIDVICQHCMDGKIIPIKFRVMTEDGELQTFMVQSCRQRPLPLAGPDLPMPQGGHIYYFECRIIVFGREKWIHLFYNGHDGTWELRN